MRIVWSALAAAAILGSTAPACFADDSAPPQRTNCFFSNQMQNWKAPDAKTIYIRVNLNRYYRLDLSSACPELTWPDAHLIMNIRGPDTICRAIDWDLKVGQGMGGIATPCIVKNMTELTPADVAAIPKKFKP